MLRGHQNNYTLISNVKSLKFDVGDNFKYNENDSLENRLKYLFNYFKHNIIISTMNIIGSINLAL